MEETRELRLRWGGQRASGGIGNHDIVDAAGFRLIAVDGLEQGLRQLQAAGQRIDNLAAHLDASLLPHIALFGKTFVAQKRFKVLTVELAGHSLEIVVVHRWLFGSPRH